MKKPTTEFTGTKKVKWVLIRGRCVSEEEKHVFYVMGHTVRTHVVA